MQKSRFLNRIHTVTLQTKLIFSFIATTIIILIVNLFMYQNINQLVNQLDAIYLSNVQLNELGEALNDVQDSMTLYLNTKTSDAMESYYRAEQDYSMLIQNLNEKVTDDNLQMMERMIRNMSDNYLEITNQTVEAKRGRNIEKYKTRYEKATELYEYIGTYVYSLNNEQFRENSSSYKMLSLSLQYLEFISIFILVSVAACNIVLITILTKSITNPLSILSKAANQVASGNLEAELVEVYSMDEIGIVSSAFNKMLVSIREYIERIKESMEKERTMKERELMMGTHLKDAQLKYLQAQINPHFLFNTLNAGAQLAMMEGADRTYEYVQNVAQFFRYNVKKNNETVSLRDEIELVDNYIYILNVRFSGDIHFEKHIDESLTNIQVPSMLLQPIVENSINYGIRDIEWQGLIQLSVYEQEETVCISIKDNGIGMTQNKIDKVMSSELRESDVSAESNGVGLSNVISRLRLFFDSKDVFDIISEGENKGTEVIIYLPNTAMGRKYEDV
ncbi:MAG: histidine kinase [Lachnospiraceae bacterium]|nr:histidine kinase [Lachnospiraceae bacterium]